jgi:hypothetical protein
MRLLNTREDAEHSALLSQLKQACWRASAALQNEPSQHRRSSQEDVWWLAVEGSIAILVRQIKVLQANVGRGEANQPPAPLCRPMGGYGMGTGKIRLRQGPSTHPARPERRVAPGHGPSATFRAEQPLPGSAIKLPHQLPAG